MGKPSAPASPDYAGAAREQGLANMASAQQSARLSNPIMETPYGYQHVDWAGEGDQRTPVITQGFSAPEQAIFDQQEAAKLGLATTANEQSNVIRNLLNTPFSFGGTPQMSLPAAGAIDRGPSAGQYGMAEGGIAAPQLQTAISDTQRAVGGPATPQLQGQLNENGIAAMPVNAGTTAQQAIMARLEPALNRQRVSTETQLINQGLRPGGEAYNNAINLLGQQENDARQQAVLQGLGLDMSANQQGFGQALDRGNFANQAALQGYGAGVTGTELANRAAAQNFQQALQSGQFGNAAQLASFGAGLDSQAARNQAIAQNFGQAQAAQQGTNAAQQQQFGQNLAGGQFGNTALQQALAQALQMRQEPINEITALMSGSQVTNPQFPGYQGISVNPAPMFDATQAQGQWDMNRYQQQVAQRNALMGGLFGLAAAPFSMFSFGGRG